MDALDLTKQLKRVLPPIAIEQVGEQLHSRTQVSPSGVPQLQMHWSQEFSWLSGIDSSQFYIFCCSKVFYMHAYNRL